MSDSEQRPAARSEEERAAFFNELMREEWRKNAPPVSGFAVATLIIGVGGWAALFVGWIIGLIWMACALVFAVASLAQIRHRERRGAVFVILGVALIAAWAVYVTVTLPA